MKEVSLHEIVRDVLSCYDEEYLKKIKVTDNDISVVVMRIMNNSDFDYIIQTEVEEYFKIRGK